ncbi:DUF6090 family protein [Christiangramia sp. SM2212]|uniref:DUF6090 family protein n=1 Tax=Christiangramia sediminicola TaxID=3073267 RepID=A0ABU1ERG0_9FLAO|nr:DUF6090 family protein [Christiangramia sp. SM2212]MDR5590980.1 DUF6090 family protein [Christiangramia sp. SM2212]
MIKFFRNIRRRLIQENRFTRYLIYAIGEIVLVVIGILIALQINNWNEERKMKKLEVSYYKNLRKDLKLDSIEYQSKTYNARRNIKKLKNVLNFIENDFQIEGTQLSDVQWGRTNVFKDTMALWISISQAGFIQFPDIFENTITDLRSTGNIKLLQNDSLKDALVEYYNDQKRFSTWNESYLPNRTQTDLVVNRILPKDARSAYNIYLDDELMFENLKINGRYKDFITKIEKEEDFEGLLNGMYHIQHRIINQCDYRQIKVNNLLATVRKEITYLKYE